MRVPSRRFCILIIVISLVSVSLWLSTDSYYGTTVRTDLHDQVADSTFGIQSSSSEEATSNAVFYKSHLTIESNIGRLGNQMFTFATLLGLSRLNQRLPLVPTSVYEALNPYFNIRCNLVDLSKFKGRSEWSIVNWLRPEDLHIPPNVDIIQGNNFPTSYTFFWNIKEEVRSFFTFRVHLTDYARDILKQIRHVRQFTEVIVGVHVRRGDYVDKSIGWLRQHEGREVDIEYFNKALYYFRTKYGNVTFIATSDDPKWTKRHLSDLGVLIAPKSPSAGHDLALLSMCDHVITTYGTYGWWAGFLSGGDVTYFMDFLRPNTNMTTKYFLYDKMFPPEWIGISTTPDGYWENYTKK